MGGFPRSQPLSLIVCVTAFSSPPALRRRGGVTKALQAVTKALPVVTQSLLGVTEPLRFVTSRYGVGWLQGACALQRHWLRSQPSSEGLAPWVVPSAPLPQGDSLWLAPSTYVMRQAPRSLCLTTALAPVPPFLGRSCPLGCSLSAPATGGFSVVSPQCSCMRQAPRKRSGPGAHFLGTS